MRLREKGHKAKQTSKTPISKAQSDHQTSRFTVPPFLTAFPVATYTPNQGAHAVGLVLQIDQPAVFLQIPADGRELVSCSKRERGGECDEVESARPRHGRGEAPIPYTYLLSYRA